jgi:ATP-dependent Clp protease ATP-binding subunit ClpC
MADGELLQRFTPPAIRVVQYAKEEARRFRGSTVGTEHVLLGLIREQDGVAARVLERLGVSLGRAQNEIRRQMDLMDTRTPGQGSRSWSPGARRVLELALDEARELNPKLGLPNFVDTEHLLLGLVRETDSTAVRVLRALGVDLEQVRREVIKLLGGAAAAAPTARGRSSTPVLDAFGRDLTKYATEDKLDPVIGRHKEIQRVIQILSRRTKNNPCLIGEPGVGKTAIAEGLAQRIIRKDVPEALHGKRVIALDLAGLVAGTKYRGEFEERMKRVTDEIRKANGEIILFVDELHTLIGAGAAEGAIDASNILKPALSRGELQCIGATTLGEYRKHVEKDPALERRFQPVMVEEPTTEETIEILKGLRSRYESHHRVTIDDAALLASARLAARYISDRFLPDKAIDVMDEAASRVRLRISEPPVDVKRVRQSLEEVSRELQKVVSISPLEREETDYQRGVQLRDERHRLREELTGLEEEWRKKRAEQRDVVGEEDIAHVVSVWTGVPVSRLAEGETEKLLQMEDRLHERIVGQEEAVRAVSRAVRRGRAGLKDPRRPVGSFLFLGPTGVGKTELARALAEFLFDHEDAMIRIDMSEYRERHTVSRLIGAPPGYVGYEEGGQLTEAVRRKPYSVILLDEVEKAHHEVFNILLQVMEDGRLTDAQGRVVDLRNTVLIMTSNVGTSSVDLGVGMGLRTGEDEEAYSHQRMKDVVLDRLKQTFRPEFLNRVDEVIVFHALTQEQVKQIVDLLLRQLLERIESQGLRLTVSEEVKDLLAREGFDRTLGARPLRRAIQRLVEDPLSESLLHGSFQEGDSVRAVLEDGAIAFRKEEELASLTHPLAPPDPSRDEPGGHRPAPDGFPGSAPPRRAPILRSAWVEAEHRPAQWDPRSAAPPDPSGGAGETHGEP